MCTSIVLDNRSNPNEFVRMVVLLHDSPSLTFQSRYTQERVQKSPREIGLQERCTFQKGEGNIRFDKNEEYAELGFNGGTKLRGVSKRKERDNKSRPI
jgi:hypothetical protein